MARVRSGTEVVIEDNSRPVAVVRPLQNLTLVCSRNPFVSRAGLGPPWPFMGTSGVISKRPSTTIANLPARPAGTCPLLPGGYRPRTAGRYCRKIDRASREYGRGPGRGALRRGLDRTRPRPVHLSPLPARGCSQRRRDAKCRIRSWLHLSVCLFSNKVA